MNQHHVTTRAYRDRAGRAWHLAACTCGWEQAAGTRHHANQLARKHENKHR